MVHDVIVVSENGSGVEAALSAARHGAWVTLLERNTLAEFKEQRIEVINDCRVFRIAQDDEKYFGWWKPRTGDPLRLYLAVNASNFSEPFIAKAVIKAKTRTRPIIKPKEPASVFYFNEGDDAESVGKAAAEYAWEEFKYE